VASDEEVQQSLKPIYVRQILSNFSDGIISPYVSIYAVQLGASSTEMGWLRSLINLLGNAMQIPWGIVSDKLGRYVPAILVGGVLSASLWLPLLFVMSPVQLIAIVSLQAFATSVVAPAWASLMGKMMPKSRRGVTTSRINIAASLGAIGATLLSGYIMTSRGGSLSNMYMIPILLASLCGLVSSIVMVTIREKKRVSGGSNTSSRLTWKVFRSNTHFQTLCKVSFIQSFFMSTAWPLFAITQVRVVKADMMQIAYISVISGVVAIFARRLFGRITDYAGRRTLLIIGRVGIFIYPVMYALATNVYHLFFADLIVGIFGAISDVVLFAYQLDIMPEDQRGTSIAFFNTVNGVSTFFGSLFGGYIPLLLGQAGLDYLLSLQLAYAISAAGRLGGGLLFLKIREPVTYPSTVKQELARVVTEDIEKTREQLKQIETRSEAADKELRRDFEWLEGMVRRKEES